MLLSVFLGKFFGVAAVTTLELQLDKLFIFLGLLAHRFIAKVEVARSDLVYSVRPDILGHKFAFFLLLNVLLTGLQRLEFS